MIFYTNILPLVVVSAFLLWGSAYGIRKIKGRCSNYLANSFLVLGSLVFCFGLLEILAINFSPFRSDSKERFPPKPKFFQEKRNSYGRVKDSGVYIILPGFQGITFGHKFTINELGFRERNFGFKKPPNTFRILVFGDSFTYGSGVSEDHRFTNLLEGFLNEKEGGTKKYEVLNFGMPGYSTDQEHDTMKVMLKLIECDLVIVAFYTNDMEMTTQKKMYPFTTFNYSMLINGEKVETYKSLDRNYNNLPKEEPLDFQRTAPWFENLKIFNILEKNTNLNIDKKLPTPSRWEFVLNEFEGMKDITKKYGLPPPVVLLIYPGVTQPSGNDFIHPTGELAQNINLLRFVGDRLGQKGFIVADPLPLFQEHSGMGMTVSEWESHSNYLGHYLFSRSILNAMSSHNLFAN
jgi:lysophospholipase L1-like esterase